MALRAVKPEIVKPSKPKFMESGKSGVGKTTFALNFPKPYFIDTEGGATREQYMGKLIENGGAYMGKEQGSQDFKTVIEQIKELATTKHPFKTLVIDSFSKLYNIAAAEAEERIGNDYGRDRKEANKPTRQLLRWIDKVDMTTILICHMKDKWERKGRDIVYSGTTFDGFEKMEYDLDLWIEVQKLGKERSYVVKKSRIAAFLEGSEHPLDYSKFCDLYGREVIEADSTPVVLSSPDQVAEIKGLLELLKIDEDEISKWLAKGGAETWEEMPADATQKCIDYCRKKIESTKGEK
jgi:GTPase SAR1 family protein